MYYGYRFYDPELGRWLSRDPVDETAANNLYSFIGNDAVNDCDVLGLIDLDSPEAQAVLSALQQAESDFTGSFMHADDGGGVREFLEKLRDALGKVRKVKFINSGPPSYHPLWNVMRIPRNPDAKTVVHELIHAYNDLMGTDYQSARLDEGMAWAVDACMWDAALQFVHLEKDALSRKSCKEIYDAVEVYWRGGWDKADFRDAQGSYQTLFGTKSFPLEASDVGHVEETLGFRLNCSEMAAYYNEILWKKGCCALISCERKGDVPAPPPRAGGDSFERVFRPPYELPKVYR